MAKLYNIAFLLAANLILIAADDDCLCKPAATAEELDELFQYLKTQYKMNVLPGALAEFVPCGNCPEQSRPKRRVIENDVPEYRREQRSPVYSRRVWRFDDNERNKCPIGYRKLFWRCLKF